jgi:large subunit ribosomal protein L6
MSRIGKKPVMIPAGVTVQVAEREILVKGPKGEEVRHPRHPRIGVEVKDNTILFSRPSDKNTDKAAHGLMRSLVAGAVSGVTAGFARTLEVNGIGYRVQVEGQKVTMALGYSHPVVYEVPAGCKVELAGKNQIVIRGFDKREVGHVASQIRALRAPEPYKGKGVKYVDEQIRRKVGKTGA